MQAYHTFERRAGALLLFYALSAMMALVLPAPLRWYEEIFVMHNPTIDTTSFGHKFLF